MSYRDQIDRKCNGCAGEDPRNCTGKNCPLWKYRISKKKDDVNDLREAVKSKCLDCCGGDDESSLRLVVTCKDDYCPLYHSRREAIGREVFDSEEQMAEIFGG
jgi:hypothetical protein